MIIQYGSRSPRRAAIVALLAISGAVWAAPPAGAQTAGGEVEALRREVQELRRRDEENRAKMAELERMLRQVLEADARRGEPDTAGVEPAPVAAAPVSTTSPAVASGGTPADGEIGTPAGGEIGTPANALDRALESSAPTSPTVAATAGAARGDLASVPIGPAAQARLIDISVSTLVAAGGSSVDDDELSGLEGGAHDPDENGFTLQQAELSLTGAVDPYFTGEAHLVGTVGGVELEEAFFTTSSLPAGFQVEAGYFLTEFGLMNPLHAHAWDWLDQPVVSTRMFGGEGLRSPGARVGWLLPTPFFSELHVGVQNADDGELTASFMGEEGIGGRPNVDRDVDSFGEMAWLGRWNASWDLSDESALLVGASMLYGPNATGGDGHTSIYGGDVKVRWRADDNFRGWPFVVWQTEVIGRDYKADGYVGGTASGGGGDDGHGHDEDEGEEEGDFPNDLPSDTLHDVGLYTQVLYGFRYGWAAGLRAEYATGSGQSVEDGVLAPRSGDSLRDNRVRISPLLVWHPTEFSRLRLQYNYDDADHLSGNDAHTVWIGGEVLYGKHAAHKY